MAVDDEAFNTLNILNPQGMDYPVWKAAVYSMIGVGAFVFLVGFLGWAGACCENNCMLITVCGKYVCFDVCGRPKINARCKES